MHLRGLGIVALAAIIWLLAAASASATERLVYEMKTAILSSPPILSMATVKLTLVTSMF